MNIVENAKDQEAGQQPSPVPNLEGKKPMVFSTKTKVMIGIAAMAAVFAGVAYIKYIRPHKAIKKYNCTPRTKKPRKARRILRRRKQKAKRRVINF